MKHEGEEELLRWMEKGLALLNASEGWRPSTTPSLVLDGASQRERLLSILEAFNECVAYLHGRRVKAKTLEVASEAAIQDVLFLMLKPVFPELTFEDPSPKSAASYAIKDFYFPSMKLVLEAKYVGSRDEVRAVEKQLADDIWKYSAHPDCEYLIFFIYDPYPHIADRRNFVTRMSRKQGEFSNLGRQVQIHTVIRP